MKIWHAALPAAATFFGLLLALQSYPINESSWAFRSPPASESVGQLLKQASTEKRPGDFLRKLVTFAITLAEDYLKHRPGVNITDGYPYWRFLPTPVFTVPTDSTPHAAQPQGACFRVSFTAELKHNILPALFGHFIRVSVHASGDNIVARHCEDNYMLASLGSFDLLKITQPGQYHKDVHVSRADARLWDAQNRGLRVFHIHGSRDEAIWSVLETARLFVSLISTPSVPEDTAARNLDFLKKYAGLDMPPRTGEINVDIPEDTVKDGDFMGLIRLDGLDPMLSWAMGSATGHTAMALRFDGKLHVVESTATSAYWPVNGMQKTEWNQWLKQYRAADYNIVHLPLSPDNAAKFNATAAREKFTSEFEGFDYGYKNMLWAWIDITDQNFPCMPAESPVQGCLSWELFEVLVSMFEDFSTEIAEMLFVPGLRRRVDLPPGSSWAEVLKAAHKKFDGKVADLPTSPEQDSWTYEVMRNGKKDEGPGRMCDALVCSLWKAGGLFGDLADKVQCTEFTNWDAWGLKLFDTNAASNRPEVCKVADPDNDLCQLSGKYSLKLRTPMYWYNERPLVAHMAERCPSMAPNYERSESC